jgi:ketopantoate reductase
MGELGGAIVRMARESGIAVPLHEAATCAIQLAEAESGLVPPVASTEAE